MLKFVPLIFDRALIVEINPYVLRLKDLRERGELLRGYL